MAERAARCARLMLVIKAAVAASAVLLVLTAVGVIRFSPVLFVTGIAAVLGGLALYGSTMSTRDQLITAVKRCEAERAAKIDALTLRNVEGD